jgi:DNA-directed RNA polymerase subunit F
MIINTQSLSMAEAMEYIKKSADEDSKADITGFIKKFNKLSFKDAKELKGKLNELNLMKLKKEHISKIIELMPENAQDLNKIFIDVSLDENETKRILETVKEFK